MRLLVDAQLPPALAHWLGEHGLSATPVRQLDLRDSDDGSIGNIATSGGWTVFTQDEDLISLTDMLKAKDGEFFIADWLRNRNTVEFLGIWESVHNPDFNCGEFAIIKSQAGLNSYKISVKDWVAKTNANEADLQRASRLRQSILQKAFSGELV